MHTSLFVRATQQLNKRADSTMVGDRLAVDRDVSERPQGVCCLLLRLKSELTIEQLHQRADCARICDLLGFGVESLAALFILVQQLLKLRLLQ